MPELMTQLDKNRGSWIYDNAMARKKRAVRTTVEGKLRMEKIVGADLITVDSCVSSAWTVRDTVTNYKVKDGHSKFKITLIENGETKMEKEATLEIPEFM
ncbi:hypothetical protein TELCIR_20793, partial [Teladorsagia circumcincta]